MQARSLHDGKRRDRDPLEDGPAEAKGRKAGGEGDHFKDVTARIAGDKVARLNGQRVDQAKGWASGRPRKQFVAMRGRAGRCRKDGRVNCGLLRGRRCVWRAAVRRPRRVGRKKADELGGSGGEELHAD